MRYDQGGGREEGGKGGGARDSSPNVPMWYGAVLEEGGAKGPNPSGDRMIDGCYGRLELPA